MNTQELAWVSIATASLIKDSRPIALEIAKPYGSHPQRDRGAEADGSRP